MDVRYYLLFRNRPKWFPFNILIHEMLDDDHGIIHNHSFHIYIILYWYYETSKTGNFWRPLDILVVSNNYHRVDFKPGTKPVTIFISGPLRKGLRSEYGIDFKRINDSKVL